MTFSFKTRSEEIFRFARYQTVFDPSTIFVAGTFTKAIALTQMKISPVFSQIFQGHQ